MRGRPVRAGMAAALLAVVTAVGGCGGEEAGSRAPEPSPESPPPESSPPPSGRLIAQLRQYSHDRARGQMEVWIRNDTGADVTPTRILYRDPRFRSPVGGDRLRLIPQGSERGFTLEFPPAVCPPRGRAAPLEVTYAGRTRKVPVDDTLEVVVQHVARECLLRRVARIADVRFADEVPVGPDGTGALVLLVTPRGRTDEELVIETVNGSYLLGLPGAPFWEPRTRVRGTGSRVRIELPVAPVRCDPHAFQEGGTATTFLVTLRAAGTEGQVPLRMSPHGMRAATDFALEVCGLADQD